MTGSGSEQDRQQQGCTHVKAHDWQQQGCTHNPFKYGNKATAGTPDTDLHGPCGSWTLGGTPLTPGIGCTAADQTVSCGLSQLCLSAAEAAHPDHGSLALRQSQAGPSHPPALTHMLPGYMFPGRGNFHNHSMSMGRSNCSPDPAMQTLSELCCLVRDCMSSTDWHHAGWAFDWWLRNGVLARTPKLWCLAADAGSVIASVAQVAQAHR